MNWMSQEAQARAAGLRQESPLDTVSRKIGDINGALIGLDQALRDGGFGGANRPMQDLRASFDQLSERIMDEVGL